MDVSLGINPQPLLAQAQVRGAVSGGKLISSGKEPSQQVRDHGLNGIQPQEVVRRCVC